MAKTIKNINTYRKYISIYNQKLTEEESNYPRHLRGSLVKRQFDNENHLIEEIHCGAIELGEDYIDRLEYEFFY